MGLFQSSRAIPWNSYLSAVLIHHLRKIYVTICIYFLGDLPGNWGVNIASQLVWISLVLEVIQEGFILPLFALSVRPPKIETRLLVK
ncbi:MAG: hypothetical protein JW776_14670 [Candidatus Lokiarchaeota archaeon]|nr:hypothetical protein [Candidatus Lokiarchaeota archaeon]